MLNGRTATGLAIGAVLIGAGFAVKAFVVPTTARADAVVPPAVDGPSLVGTAAPLVGAVAEPGPAGASAYGAATAVRTGPVDPATLDTDWRIVMFTSPKCTCVIASIAELADAIRASGATPLVTIVASGPNSDPEAVEWLREQLPVGAGWMLTADPAGESADRFGVETSGHVFVIDGQGVRRFTGGVTPAQAQRGENAGAAAVRAILAGELDAAESTSVFGCPIFQHKSAHEGEHPAGEGVGAGERKCPLCG